MSRLRILIADDHDLIRRGLRTLLESQGWIICAEVRNGLEAVEKADELRPDIAVLDITMPRLNGLEAARRIRNGSPDTKILICSMHYSEQILREVLDAGAHGYVAKADSEHELVKAVETLSKHELFVTPQASQELILNLQRKPFDSVHADPMDARLTSRENEVLQICAEGKSNKEVATVLNMAIRTVEAHRSNIMRKLKLQNSADLTRYAVRNRMIDP